MTFLGWTAQLQKTRSQLRVTSYARLQASNGWSFFSLSPPPPQVLLGEQVTPGAFFSIIIACTGNLIYFLFFIAVILFKLYFIKIYRDNKSRNQTKKKKPDAKNKFPNRFSCTLDETCIRLCRKIEHFLMVSVDFVISSREIFIGWHLISEFETLFSSLR